MKFKFILAVLILFLCANSLCFADSDVFSIKDIMNAFSDEKSSDISIKSATNKFKQVNIKSAYKDFEYLIDNNKASNLEMLSLYEKMSELGFFSLVERSKLNIKDTNFKFYQNSVHDFYNISKPLTMDDELLLADVYSNIVFNDRAVDAVKELDLYKDLLKKSDYANYIMALGLYKTNNYKEAIHFINSAISMNSKCENYKFLKIKLLAETGQRNDALRIFNSYNRKKELPYNYRRKCELLKQFILYKTEKNQWERNYALGRYYYTEEDYLKAMKSLQNASLTKNRKDLTRVWGIMSRTYLKLGYDEKAKEYALKSYKNNSENKDANVTLARISLKNQEYDKALNYFKTASKDDKLDTSKIKVAQLYLLNDEVDKAKKVYFSLIKKSSDEWESYYNLAIIDNNIDYIYKSLASNPYYKDAWVELIKNEISNKDYVKAKEYLKNLLYIDDKDFRYYYYEGIISREKGNNVEAARYFKKSVDLNPDDYNADKALLELKEYI